MTTIDFKHIGRTGKTKIVAKSGSGKPHAFKADLLDQVDKERVLTAICNKLPGLDREELEDRLDAEAAKVDGAGGTQANLILRHLLEPGRLELFHSRDREPFAFVRLSSGKGVEHDLRETLHLKSTAFSEFLSGIAYRELGMTPTGETFSSVISALAARALYEGPERPVFVRIGEHGGDVWIDLVNERRELVRVTRQGWAVVPAADAPVRMVRKAGMLALPAPTRDGSLEDLRALVNVDDAQWVLVRAFLLMAFRPRGPYPILLVNGEQGSAKSTFCTLLRMLVDPNSANIRRPPTGGRDLAIAARNGWLPCFDNLSGVSPSLSDDLCALATGGGFATRALYSDDEEAIFKGARPMILNGIEDLGARPDLADRGVHIVLKAIDEHARREEASILAEFERVRAGVLGVLLDAAALALDREATTVLERLPRMADFARWGEAGAPALGLQQGEFLGTYRSNRAKAAALALDSSPFATAIRDRIEGSGDWVGPVGELLGVLSTEENAKQEGWPRSPRKAAALLRRFAPCLRLHGIEVTAGDERDPKDRRTIYRIALVQSESAGSARSADGDSAAALGGAQQAPHAEDLPADRFEEIGRTGAPRSYPRHAIWTPAEDSADPADRAQDQASPLRRTSDREES